jgi:Arc/MetJ family transcription regulator
MPTNLALDDRLIDEARRIGRHKTKKAAVTEALREYIQRRKQLRILDLAGKVDYDPDYDYKALRRRRPR